MALKIEDGTGYMAQTLKKYFPTTSEEDSQEIAMIIEKYCTKREIRKLLRVLRYMEKIYQMDIHRNKNKAALAVTGHEEFKLAHDFWEWESRWKRLRRDIENIERRTQ